MSEGLRQAALALHAMHPEDRHWAMRSLNAGQREALSTLLDELSELGIPRDATLLLSLAEGDKAMRAPLTDEDSQSLDAMPEKIAIAALRREPAHFVELLLGLYPWAWRDAWYAAQPSAKTRNMSGPDEHTPVSEVLRTSAVKHARMACEALLAEGYPCTASVSNATATGSTSILRGIFGRWKRARGGLA